MFCITYLGTLMCYTSSWVLSTEEETTTPTKKRTGSLPYKNRSLNSTKYPNYFITHEHEGKSTCFNKLLTSVRDTHLLCCASITRGPSNGNASSTAEVSERGVPMHHVNTHMCLPPSFSLCAQGIVMRKLGSIIRGYMIFAHRGLC